MKIAICGSLKFMNEFKNISDKLEGVGLGGDKAIPQ